MHEVAATKYPKPNRLSDPYRDFSDELKKSILQKDGRNLNACELTALFAGSVPAGTYDESAHYLPDVTRYLAEHYWESVPAGDEEYEELFKKFLMWTVFFHSELVKDGTWDSLNLYLSDLFALATGRFELRGGVPAGLDHAGYFFRYSGHKSFMQTDDPPGTCRDFPFGITDAYMERRFASPSTYADHAWLILLVNGSRGLTGLYGVADVRDSAFLEKLWNDTAWRTAAVTAVIAETEAHPELTDYWSACLDNGMFF